MCHAILQSLQEGRSSSSFYLICKPTASALENAVNKVTLVYLAMLDKIGYLFTREILFCTFRRYRLCCNHFGMMFEFLCFWFSIENVKTVPYLWWKSHKSEKILCWLTSCWMKVGFSSHTNITKPNLLPLMYYLGTFNVNERLQWETLREGHEEKVKGAWWLKPVCLSLVGMKIDLVYANECCRDLSVDI